MSYCMRFIGGSAGLILMWSSNISFAFGLDGVLGNIKGATDSALEQLKSAQLENIKSSLPALIASKNGNRPLAMEPDVTNNYGFSYFMGGGRSPTTKTFLPTMKPRVDSYFLLNWFPRLTYSKQDGVEGFTIDAFLSRGYGYKNSEQAFCDTIRNTLIEQPEDREGAKIFPADINNSSKKSNYEILNAIKSGHGFVDAKGSSGDYITFKVYYIDEFGGDLASDVKIKYINSLLAMDIKYLDYLRFSTKKESNEFMASCYAAVSGDLAISPLVFSSPEEDYLINKIPEARSYLLSKASSIKNEAIDVNLRNERDLREESTHPNAGSSPAAN